MRNCLVALLLAALGASASAGQFSVSPVRIYMAARDRAVALTVTNEGDTELVMQADIYQWRQQTDGEDDLTLSEDMILAPPIIKLAPKARQVVRLAMLSPVSAGPQRTYRLIVREIPESKAALPGVQLQIALAFSLPVFISPPGVKRDLVCDVQRSAPSTVKAVCENRGSAYAQPVSFTLADASGNSLASSEKGGYVLAGNKRSFDISRAEGRIPGGKARLTVSQDDSTTQVFDVLLAD